MTELLFSDSDSRNILRAQESKMVSEIESLDEDRLLNTSAEALCDYFVDIFVIDPPQIDENGIETDYGDARVDVRNRFEYAVFDTSRPSYVTGTRMTFFIPFEGDAALFKCQPSTFRLNPPRAIIKSGEVQMVYEGTTNDATKFESNFKRHLEDLKEYLSWIVSDVAPFNSSLREKVRQRIEGRRDKLLKDKGLTEQIGYPLRRRDATPRTYVAPEVKRKIAPGLPPVSDGPFTPEPVLEMAEYEYILSVVSNMVLVMERSPKAFGGMGEEDLRQHFLVQLNGQYEGQATGETFNFEGKTDILLRVEGKNIFIAECKFWDGPTSLTNAIDQLLGYATWRDTKIALLLFNRDRSLSTVLGRIPETVHGHPNFKSDQAYESETGFRFIFSQRDDLNREITLTVLVFEVPA